MKDFARARLVGLRRHCWLGSWQASRQASQLTSQLADYTSLFGLSAPTLALDLFGARSGGGGGSRDFGPWAQETSARAGAGAARAVGKPDPLRRRQPAGPCVCASVRLSEGRAELALAAACCRHSSPASAAEP